MEFLMKEMKSSVFFLPKVMLLWNVTAGTKRLLQLLFFCWVALMYLPAHAAVIGGIDFPSTLGGFELGTITDYEKLNPGAGVSLSYNIPGVKAEVYVYNSSQHNIPEGIDSSVIRKEFSAVSDHIQKAYPDTQILVLEERLLVDGIPILHSVFGYVEMKPGSREIKESHLYLTARKGNLIKVRVTYSYSGSDNQGHSRRMQTEFIESLFRVVAKTVAAVPYKSPDSLIEAWVGITKHFLIFQKASEVCGRYTSLKKESEETAKKYMTENKPVFVRATQRLLDMAEKRGGEAGRSKLMGAIEAALPKIDESSVQNLGQFATIPRDCTSLLSILRRGDFDLNAMKKQEIEAIMSSSE